MATATTMVDRITPRITPDDLRTVERATGAEDHAPVVTEPFSEWVIAGEFPGGRPRWDAAGATLTADAAPFERRKLWLLNGGHSLLAYAGSLRGHATVAEAMADATCRAWLEGWWDEAAAHLDLDAGDYRAALLERFENPRIQHRLAQIAADGSQKLPVRVLPVLRAERAAGRLPEAATRDPRRVGLPSGRAGRARGRRGRTARPATRARSSPRSTPRWPTTTRSSPPWPRRDAEELGRPMSVVIGLDAGTTGVKAAAFGIGTAERRVAIREYPLLQPRPGWQVQDPEAILAAATSALAECVAAVGSDRVEGSRSAPRCTGSSPSTATGARSRRSSPGRTRGPAGRRARCARRARRRSCTG